MRDLYAELSSLIDHEIDASLVELRRLVEACEGAKAIFPFLCAWEIHNQAEDRFTLYPLLEVLNGDPGVQRQRAMERIGSGYDGRETIPYLIGMVSEIWHRQGDAGPTGRVADTEDKGEAILISVQGITGQARQLMLALNRAEAADIVIGETLDDRRGNDAKFSLLTAFYRGFTFENILRSANVRRGK